MRDRDTENLLNRFVVWRQQHISERQFVLILSLLVGVLTAFAAIILKSLIHEIHHLLTSSFDETKQNYLFLIYPVVGIFLSGLFIRYIVRDDIGHGVTKILYALAKKNGRIKPHNMGTSLVASAITIGMGGSVGAEAPIVMTGSAIGSNIGRMFKMEHKTLMLLIGCGAAGAVAGILTGAAVDILWLAFLKDFGIYEIIPGFFASAIAAIVVALLTKAPGKDVEALFDKAAAYED